MTDELLWSGMVRPIDEACVGRPSVQRGSFGFDPFSRSVAYAISTPLLADYRAAN